MDNTEHAEEFARTWAVLRPTLLKFAAEIEHPLTVADAGRMYLAAAVMAFGSELPPMEIGAALRSMADRIEQPPEVAH